MQNITFDDEEEGGIDIGVPEEIAEAELVNGFNNKLCLVGRFIIEGIVDFQAMQHTLTALWKPGKGVHIR